MNVIQETKPPGLQYNQLLDAVVTMMKYENSTTSHDIYINVFSNGIVSYVSFNINGVLNNTNNETSFPELRRVFKKILILKFKKYMPLST